MLSWIEREIPNLSQVLRSLGEVGSQVGRPPVRSRSGTFLDSITLKNTLLFCIIFDTINAESYQIFSSKKSRVVNDYK